MEEGAGIARAARVRWRNTVGGRAAIARGNKRFREKGVNAEKDRINQRRYREAKAGIACELPVGYEELVFEIFGDQCAACHRSREAVGLVLDHHRPLRDGHPLLHNAVPLCGSCNAKKNRKSPEAFYEQPALMMIFLQLWDVRNAYEVRFGSGEPLW